jgi:hypothetical protein
MKARRIAVVGTLASDPYAGMAWMHLQIVVGLLRLGHDAYYMEVTSAWPYDPVQQQRTGNSDYALPYLARVAESFGLAGRWAYRRSYADKKWFGMSQAKAEELLAHSDAVFNITGGTRLRTKEELSVNNLVYYGTDPVYPEIGFAQGDPIVSRTINQHDAFVTYGENIGSPDCPIPPLPRLKAHTRQPVLMDLWEGTVTPRPVFTTVGNWKQTGRDIEFRGETYLWSKHHEFLKFIDAPRRSGQAVELATNLVDPEVTKPGYGEVIRAAGMTTEERDLLAQNCWRLTSAHAFSTDPWTYRDYIQSSRAEFTVARDQNVRLRSGWFSERSACYLAAGRPVITQDTGFGKYVPTGEGLFAFNSTEEIIEAFDAIRSDYHRHSRAARRIAEEYFNAETVLEKVVRDLGL